jgi:hypothetical protein
MSEITQKTIYFQKPGKANTQRTLQLAKQRADEMGIKTILISTTTGDSAVLAVGLFRDSQIIAVTHSAGFSGPDTQELLPENRKIIEEAGGKILTCQHAFGGVNRAVRKKLDTYQLDEIIAFTLRLFGQGMKVVAEIALMAADAGLVRTDQPLISIAGTGRGADTAVVLFPTNAQTFFDLKIVETICMPSPAHPDFG